MSDSDFAQILDLQTSSAQLVEQGRFSEALAAIEQAIHLDEELEGSGSPDLANLLADRAQIFAALGRHPAAQQDAARALAILEPIVDQITPPDGDILLLRVLGLSGTALREQGRYPEAEPLLRRAVARAESVFGEAGGYLATALNNLGVLYKYSGEFPQAEQQYRRALAITEVDGDAMALATLYHNLGGLEHARGCFAAGEPWARRAYELRAARLGWDHPITVADGAALGGLLDGLGRFSESEPLYRKALAVFETLYGPCHFELAVNYNNLAALLCQTGRRDEGEALYRRALTIKEKLFAPGHPEIALGCHNLGVLLITAPLAHQRHEAEALLRRALALFEAALPATHPSLIACRAGLAQLAAARCR